MKLIAWIVLAILVVIGCEVALWQPDYLSDKNTFLLNFVNHELLAFLGVIVTITLASAASLHLEFNRIQERTSEAFPEARRAIKYSAYSLIVAFMAAFALVVVKPVFADTLTKQAFCNIAALLIILFNVVVLVDITRAVFRIPALPDAD